MKYRNIKRLVSIWLLEKLRVANKAHYVGQATVSTSVEVPQYIRPKDPYKVSELVKLNKYKPSIIYEASFFLISRGYIESVGMINEDIANTSIKITDEGINALRDEVLEDEINNYNNDRYYSYLRWWVPILALIVSLTSIFFSTCKRAQPLQQKTEPASLPVRGVMKLLTGTTIEKRRYNHHRLYKRQIVHQDHQ